MEKKLQTCLASIREKTDFKPEVALILGSGWEIMQTEFRLKRPWITPKSKDFRYLQ